MVKKPIKSPQLLALATTTAAHFADELVGDPVAELELRSGPASEKAQQTRADYSRGRDQALTRGRGGRSLLHLSRTELHDSSVGRGETSAQLLARRLR